MRTRYLSHPIYQTLSGKLTWAHYCTLLDVSDPNKRSFYEHEAADAGWSIRGLRRQMDSLLFERVLAAKLDKRTTKSRGWCKKMEPTPVRNQGGNTAMDIVDTSRFPPSGQVPTNKKDNGVKPLHKPQSQEKIRANQLLTEEAKGEVFYSIDDLMDDLHS